MAFFFHDLQQRLTKGIDIHGPMDLRCLLRARKDPARAGSISIHFQPRDRPPRSNFFEFCATSRRCRARKHLADAKRDDAEMDRGVESWRAQLSL